MVGRAVWFNPSSDYGDFEVTGVTHWMPLPKDPTEYVSPVGHAEAVVGSGWVRLSDRVPVDEWEHWRKETGAAIYPCLGYRCSDMYRDKWYVTKVYFDGEYFVDLDNVILDAYLTHWMPLPEAPKDGVL